MVGLWNATISAIATRPPRPMKPMMTAFGANGKIAQRQSTARTCIWNELLGIPTNAAVISMN